MGASAVEERRVVILTRGVLEFMEELESADTWSCNTGCKKGRGEKKSGDVILIHSPKESSAW